MIACKGTILSIGKDSSEEYRPHSVVRDGEVVTQEENAHEPPALPVERIPFEGEKKAVEHLSDSLRHRAIAVRSSGSMEMTEKKEESQGDIAPKLHEGFFEEVEPSNFRIERFDRQGSCFKRFLADTVAPVCMDLVQNIQFCMGTYRHESLLVL